MRSSESGSALSLSPSLLFAVSAVIFILGCADPCARLLETVCKDLPNEHHCRSYRQKVSSGHISAEMCGATRRAYVASREEEHE